MTTERLVALTGALLVGVGLVVACGSAMAPSVGLESDAPLAQREGCELANQRCSRCHSIERVLAMRVDEPIQWRTYVRRMRLQPASGISPDDESIIVSCLVRYSFGVAGLDVLNGKESP